MPTLPVRDDAIPDAATLTAPTRPPKAELEARIRSIAAGQGVAGTAAAERVLGSGGDLWASDAELDEFLRAIRDTR